MQRLMLDIETFSRQPNAAVFEVAIVPFDDRGMVDQVECSRDLGHWQWTQETGHFEGETVVWWMQRGGRPDINAANGLGEAEVVGKIYEYLARFPESELWSGPSSFDCVILQQLFERYSHKMPVGFRQYRDLTTLRAAAGFPVVPRSRKKHEAFNDCLHQIAVWAECRHLLGLNGGQTRRSLPSTPVPECAETTDQRPAPPTTRQYAGPTEGCPNYTPSDIRASLPTAREFVDASRSLARGTPGLRVEMKEPPVGESDAEFWKECAAQHLRNEEFYRGLLDQCAVHLGPEVYTQDDGGHSDEPLRLKIPGAVCSLAALGPLALTDAQVAHLEEKRGCDVWTTADFNRALRGLRG